MLGRADSALAAARSCVAGIASGRFRVLKRPSFASGSALDQAVGVMRESRISSLSDIPSMRVDACQTRYAEAIARTPVRSRRAALSAGCPIRAAKFRASRASFVLAGIVETVMVSIM